MKIRASTIYEVLIAMLIFISIATIAFYTLYSLNLSYKKNDVLKYEALIDLYKEDRELIADLSLRVEEEVQIYPLAETFIWIKYKVIDEKGTELYVKNELNHAEDE